MPIAILSRGKPVFYCIPARLFESMAEKWEDLQLNDLADSRADQEAVDVRLADL